MDDLTVYVGPLLLLAGAVFQFALRQFKAVPEIVYWACAFGLSFGVWLLTSRVLIRPDHWQLDSITALLWIATAIGTVRGGSSITDAAATKAVAANPNLVGNPMVPKTNSL